MLRGRISAPARGRCFEVSVRWLTRLLRFAASRRPTTVSTFALLATRRPLFRPTRTRTAVAPTRRPSSRGVPGRARRRLGAESHTDTPALRASLPSREPRPSPPSVAERGEPRSSPLTRGPCAPPAPEKGRRGLRSSPPTLRPRRVSRASPPALGARRGPSLSPGPRRGGRLRSVPLKRESRVVLGLRSPNGRRSERPALAVESAAPPRRPALSGDRGRSRSPRPWPCTTRAGTAARVGAWAVGTTCAASTSGRSARRAGTPGCSVRRTGAAGPPGITSGGRCATA